MGVGDFFSQGPTTIADVPIAALRGLLRAPQMPEVASPAPLGRPNMTPPAAMRSTPPPDIAPPQFRENNEWGNLTKQAMDVAKGFESKPEPDFKNYMRGLDQQIAEMRALRSTSSPSKTNSTERPALDDATGDYIARNASFESGNRPSAVNAESGASGLFQFMPSTWAGIMKERPDLGLTTEGIFDPKQQRKAMEHYTQTSAGILSPMLGRKPTGGELYLLHLLGHAGGPRVLKDMDAPITSTVGNAAYKANPFLKQYRTGHDLIAGLNDKFGGA